MLQEMKNVLHYYDEDWPRYIIANRIMIRDYPFHVILFLCRVRILYRSKQPCPVAPACHRRLPYSFSSCPYSPQC